MIIKYWSQVRQSTVFKFGVAAFVSYVLYSLAGFFLPVLLAVALAFALYPLVDCISRIRVAHGLIRMSNAVAIILALIAFIAFITVVVAFILLPLFGQINEFLQKLPAFLAKSNLQDLDAMLKDPSKIPALPSNVDMLIDGLINWAMGFVGTLLRNLFQSSLSIVQNLIGLIVVPFLTFYFLKDWKQLRSMFINLFNYDVQDNVASVTDEIGRTLSAYVRGMGKLCLISCFVITLGTAAIGIDFPLMLGFWALLAETVPVLGPLMGAVPAVFIAYGQEPALAFRIAIFYLVYYQIDANYIMPKIMGQKIDLHPVVLIASLLIGAKLFGILGMVFAVPVAAVYRVLYKRLWHAGETR